jgi:hypothetical protein
MFDLEGFKRLKEIRRQYYSGLEPVYCPALDEHVHFTSEGFFHLRYKSQGHERDKRIQKAKLVFLPEAVKIIQRSTTYQEYRSELTTVGEKSTRDGLRKTAEMRWYGFQAVIREDCRIRVIVRRVGDGQIHFWSVMPDWYESKLPDGTIRKRVGKKDMATI